MTLQNKDNSQFTSSTKAAAVSYKTK